MNSKARIWLSSPHMHGNEQEFIKEAFATNWVSPLGPNIDGFEEDLEHFLGFEKKVACLNSGTSALHLGLIQLGVGQGDEVICQSFTFSASANPILYLGASPVFVDSELSTWNICPTALEEAIKDRIQKGKKPKAIVAVHLYGTPYQVDEVHAIASSYQIPVLEDAAEALGAHYKGRKCGTFGTYATLSFNGNKIITTSGGGALVCSTKQQKENSIFLATQAKDAAPHYQHSQVGYNYRMSNILAGIGRGQMKVLPQHIQLRRQMHQFYETIFKTIDAVDVFSTPSNDFFSNYWLTTILVHPEKCNNKTREDLRLAFLAANIESRPLWKPLHMQPIFSKYPYYGKSVCENLFKDGLCLPSGSNLTDDDRIRIKAVIQHFFKKNE